MLFAAKTFVTNAYAGNDDLRGIIDQDILCTDRYSQGWWNGEPLPAMAGRMPSSRPANGPTDMEGSCE